MYFMYISLVWIWDGNQTINGISHLFTKGMKTSSKQDEAWIMNRLIKQLTDMGFPVSSVHS